MGGWGGRGVLELVSQPSCPFQYNMLHKPIGLAWCVTTQYVGEDSGLVINYKKKIIHVVKKKHVLLITLNSFSENNQ